jgi:hypothetical protein
MNNKIQQLREKLLQMDEQEFKNLLNEGNDRTKRSYTSQVRGWERTGYMAFDINRIHKLAKPFTNAQQMINYVGENDKAINSAGRYIQYNYQNKCPRPSWFEEVYKGESPEECLQILNDNCTTSKEIYEKGYVRILNRLWRFYSPEELRKLTPNIKWNRTDWNDELVYSILSMYENNRELRKAKIHKHLITKLQVDKGEKFPESYKLYQSMMIPQSEISRPKRGNYKPRKK